jgi:hypothetical protein
MFQACLDREIKSGSIGAGLAARYDFTKHFEQLVASALQFGQLPVNLFSGSRSECCSRVSEAQIKRLTFALTNAGFPAPRAKIGEFPRLSLSEQFDIRSNIAR